jgi:SAM-dependent methyltransferase
VVPIPGRQSKPSPTSIGIVVWDELQSSYDWVADAYETRFVDELEGKPRDRELLDLFAASVDDPVVDAGCGPGQIGAYVRRRGHVVVGLDLSFEMVRRAARRLDSAIVADMRSLPVMNRTVGGLVAFYSVIHVRRAELDTVLVEFARVLRPRGRLLLSAHEGRGEIERDDFLGEPVPVVATLFELDELVGATSAAGLQILRAERRRPYPTESDTTRLYVEAAQTEPAQ